MLSTFYHSGMRDPLRTPADLASPSPITTSGRHSSDAARLCLATACLAFLGKIFLIIPERYAPSLKAWSSIFKLCGAAAGVGDDFCNRLITPATVPGVRPDA
jgi:hypothetical protein